MGKSESDVRLHDIRAEGQAVHLARAVGLVFALSMTGCAGPKSAPPEAVSQSSPPQAGGGAVTPAVSRPSAPSALAPPVSTAPAKSAAPPAPAAQPSAKASAPPGIATPKAPPLDLASLKQRLKDTKAIGILTKVTLKNQVDDLLDQFRGFYEGKLKTDLANLRRSYDLLVLKVLSLLQDSDQALAAAIVASREAIWGILSDPAKFATI